LSGKEFLRKVEMARQERQNTPKRDRQQKDSEKTKEEKEKRKPSREKNNKKSKRRIYPRYACVGREDVRRD